MNDDFTTDDKGRGLYKGKVIGKCKNCGPPYFPGKLIKATKSLKYCAVCGGELSPEITKAKFEELKKKCPWFLRIDGRPYCRAMVHDMPHHAFHCSKKNCAPLYWMKNMKQEEL